MSLPDIEEYIGHKIPLANYNPDELPKLIKPKYKPRAKPQGGRRSGGGGKPGGRRR